MAAADAEAAELADAAASMSAETADCAEKKKAEAKIDEANQKAKDAKDRAEKMKSDMEEELNLTHFRLSSQVSFKGDCHLTSLVPVPVFIGRRVLNFDMP